jgi:hypothetical protein
MEKHDLIDILHGDISRINEVNERDIALYEVRVAVTPNDVRAIMLKYLLGEITANDLINWAGFICVRAEYVPPEINQSDPDYYEDMFYVIQCLSTPEIDGEVNEERVRQYLSELAKYPSNSV